MKMEKPDVLLVSRRKLTFTVYPVSRHVLIDTKEITELTVNHVDGDFTTVGVSQAWWRHEPEYVSVHDAAEMVDAGHCNKIV